MAEKVAYSAIGTAEGHLAKWAEFYEKFFGIDLGKSDIPLPEPKPGYEWPIVVAKGLTLNRAHEVCAKHFPCRCSWPDLDKEVSHNDRSPAKSGYAVWVLDAAESEKRRQEFNSRPRPRRRKTDPTEITLLERILFELYYWHVTGEHIDKDGWMFCAGSKDHFKQAVDAYWSVNPEWKEYDQIFVITPFHAGCGRGPVVIFSRYVLVG